MAWPDAEHTPLRHGIRISKKEEGVRRAERLDAEKKGWRPVDFQPKKLRSFFASRADRLGAQDRWIKAYMGHSAGDVLGKHYLKNYKIRAKEISNLMNGWRKGEEKENARQNRAK